MTDYEALLGYWIDEIGPQGWFREDPAVDGQIRERFEPLWERTRAGDRLGWTALPRSTLALLILMDQFPRNMFRGEARAFATDRAALAVAKQAIDRGWDKRLAEPERQFFYMPLMHSECLGDQNRCVRLVAERMPEGRAQHLLHAKAHREVIRRYGRFPARNDDLGRPSSGDEAHFLSEGGYGAVVRSLREPA